jgi:predicted permease
VLAFLGGLAAYALVALAWRVLPAVVPVTIPRLAAARADWTVLAFALGVSLVNGILFGIVPALRAAARARPVAVAGLGARGSGGDRVRSGLITVEVALAMILVILGGQLLASFIRVMRTDPGFSAQGLIASVIVPAGEQYQRLENRIRLFQRILDSVRTIPGVEGEGTVDALPFSGENNSGLVSTTEAAVLDPKGQEQAEVDIVSNDYLQAMGTRLLEGRWFREEEMGVKSDVAIVDDFAARRFWPGRSAIGQQVCANCLPGQRRNWKRVVGVVSSMRHMALDGPPGSSVYLAQGALSVADFLLVRTSRPEAEVALAIRRAVAAIDPNQPVFLTASLSSFVADSIADRRFIMTLLAALAFLALAMSAAGVYGVVAYTTSRRTQEIGIRMAVGATPHRIHALIFRQGFLAVAGGLTLGLAVALILLRTLRGWLAGLEANPIQVVIAIGVVTFAAAIACWIPSRRATRIDPMSALRCE